MVYMTDTSQPPPLLWGKEKAGFFPTHTNRTVLCFKPNCFQGEWTPTWYTIILFPSDSVYLYTVPNPTGWGNPVSARHQSPYISDGLAVPFMLNKLKLTGFCGAWIYSLPRCQWVEQESLTFSPLVTWSFWPLLFEAIQGRHLHHHISITSGAGKGLAVNQNIHLGQSGNPRAFGSCRRGTWDIG